jgi:hypothetical protein
MIDRSVLEPKSNGRKWIAAGMAAAFLLACPFRGRAQSSPKPESQSAVSSAPSGSSQAIPDNLLHGGDGQTSGPGRVVLAVAKTRLTSNAGKAHSETDTHTKTIRIWDACDPASFNAAVGPGTCLAGHHGQTNFNDFFGELQLDQIAGGWRFNPLLNTTEGVLKLGRVELEPGDRLSLQNMGGEVHTFTKVEEFGGGFFAPLNPITGNPEPAPECARVLPNGSLAPQPETDTNQFVEAGTTELGPFAGTRALPLGVTHWQCCVHPWMRMNITVREHDQDHDHEHEHQP